MIMTTTSFTTVPSQLKQNVAIIGCGSSGLVTLKELLAEGHTGTIFERAPYVGGIFKTTYQEGQMVSSTIITMFSDFLGSDGERALTNPRMLTFVEYSKYLEEYAIHFGLLPHIRFDHEVQRIKRDIDDMPQWRVQIRRGTSDVEWYEEIFDRVAICSGAHQRRAMPVLVGIEHFQGKIRHMQDVKTFDEFTGKRVCLIGSGEAGSDMALAASKYGRRAVVSIRRDHGYLVSRYQFGSCEPSDLQTTRVRNSIPAIFSLFQVIIRMCFEMFSLFLGSSNDQSLNIERQIFAMNAKQIRTSHFRNTYGTKSEGLAEAILNYGCAVKPSIRSVGKHSIIFDDSTEEHIDEIVCCTGFENRFPFLDCIEDDSVLQQVGHEARIPHNLYKHAMHPLMDDSLIFIGFVRPCFGATPPLAEMQARWFSLLCSGKIRLPVATIMIDWIRAYVHYIKHLLTPYRTDRITNLTDFLLFSDDLARDIGCRPNFGLNMLFHDPYLWLRCMVGPINNAQYRLCGPNAYPEQARHILLTLKWKPLWYNLFELILLYISALLWYCGIRKCQPHTWASIYERNI